MTDWLKSDRPVERITLRSDMLIAVFQALSPLKTEQERRRAVLLVMQKLLIDCDAAEIDPLAIVNAALASA